MRTVRDIIIGMMVDIEYEIIGDDPELIKDMLLNGVSGYSKSTDEEIIACAYTYLVYDGETEVRAMLEEWESQIEMSKVINNECPF